ADREGGGGGGRAERGTRCRAGGPDGRGHAGSRTVRARRGAEAGAPSVVSLRASPDPQTGADFHRGRGVSGAGLPEWPRPSGGGTWEVGGVCLRGRSTPREPRGAGARDSPARVRAAGCAVVGRDGSGPRRPRAPLRICGRGSIG